VVDGVDVDGTVVVAWVVVDVDGAVVVVEVVALEVVVDVLEELDEELPVEPEVSITSFGAWPPSRLTRLRFVDDRPVRAKE
jgi:hypothetical protein